MSTEGVAVNTRDRIIAVEVEVEHLQAEVKALRLEIEQLRAAVSDLVALLNQAKGGKLVFGAMLSGGGFLAGLLASWGDIVKTVRGWLS